MQSAGIGVVPSITVVRFHGCRLNGLGIALAIKHDFFGVVFSVSNISFDGRRNIHAFAHEMRGFSNKLLRVAHPTPATMLTLHRRRQKRVFIVWVGWWPYHLSIFKCPPNNGVFNSRENIVVFRRWPAQTHITSCTVVGGY